MANTIKPILLLFIVLLLGCGAKEQKKKESFTIGRQPEAKTVVDKAENMSTSVKVDLSNKGIGPVTSMELTPEIDQTMVSHGQKVFKKMCTACHRPDKKFIGSAPSGILERRSPEWIMNMILNPEEMIRRDPLAKELLVDFNGSPMLNQNLTEVEARAILEYFRTLN